MNSDRVHQLRKGLNTRRWGNPNKTEGRLFAVVRPRVGPTLVRVRLFALAQEITDAAQAGMLTFTYPSAATKPGHPARRIAGQSWRVMPSVLP